MGRVKQLKQAILADLGALKIVVSESCSLEEVGRRYNMPRNGKTTQWLRSLLPLIHVMEVDVRKRLIEKKTLYPWVDKTCPACKQNFRTQSGHPKETTFCSQTCANRTNITRSPKVRKHLSDIMLVKAAAKGIKPKKAAESRLCQHCNILFLPVLEKTRFCSHSCQSTNRGQDPAHRQKLRDIQLARVASGVHKGWKSRSKVLPSYAERFFMKVLKNHDIPYDHEKPQSGYFIDFAIVLSSGRKIALEIDGKQHLRPDRAASDRLKDAALAESNWHVYRIKWKSINTISGKSYIRSEIDNFMSYLEVLSTV